MQKIKYVLTVIFLGLCIIVGLNFNLFLNKTSNFIYVVSGQQERDIKVQENLIKEYLKDFQSKDSKRLIREKWKK